MILNAKPNFLKPQKTSYFLPERQYECKILNDRKSTENIVFQSFSKINGNWIGIDFSKIVIISDDKNWVGEIETSNLYFLDENF